MKITIDLTKALADVAGAREFRLDLPDKKSLKLKDVFSELVKKHPRMGDLLYESDGTMNYHIMIFINDKPLQSSEEETVEVKNGDTIHFYPIIGGG